MDAQIVMLVMFVVSLILLSAVAVVFMALGYKMNKAERERSDAVWKNAWQKSLAEAGLMSEDRKRLLDTLMKQEGWIASFGSEVVKKSEVSMKALEAFGTKLVIDAVNQIGHAAADACGQARDHGLRHGVVDSRAGGA